MHTHILSRIVSASIVSAALLALSGCHKPHVIAPPPHDGVVHGITVEGTGKAVGKPDVARANLGIEVRAPVVEQATEQANVRMQAVINALKAAGIAANDIRTTNFSVSYEQQPEPPWPPPQPLTEPSPTSRTQAPPAATAAAAPAAPPQPQTRGEYRVSNVVEVTIRDLPKVGDVLGQALRAGANNVWGVNYMLDEPAALEAKAREKAVADAKARAENLARLAGTRLGPVISITEGYGGPSPIPMRMGMMRAEVASVPVEAGELTVTSQVQIVYALPCDHD